MSDNATRCRSCGMNFDSGEKTWLTPPSIINALGEFDTDPCVPDDMPWRTAKTMYTKSMDGLAHEWSGRVWLNPPYGRDSYPFLERMSKHRNGIALLFGRTDTRSWHRLVFPYCDSILFMEGRVSFCRPDGSAGGASNAPSCLVSYSKYDSDIMAASGIRGFLMKGYK